MKGSVGADFAPQFAPGLRASATLFNAKFEGGVTSPNLAAIINSAALNSLLTFYPNGATAADIAAATVGVPQSGALPPVVYYIYNFRQRNVLNLDIRGLDLQASYRHATDGAGTFTIGASGTKFLKYKQNFGGGPTFDVLNTTGFNQTFPSIGLQGRANVGWEYGPFALDIFANHIGSYTSWASTAVNRVEIAGGIPTGGGDPVASHTTFDAHIGYKLQEGGVFSESELYVDTNNIFDNDPPFYNSSHGYDVYGGNLIGRVVTVGFRARY